MKQLILKLLISLLIFTFIIIMTISISNRQMLKSNIQAEQKESWELVESHIINDMQTVDKAYLYYDFINSSESEQELRTLRDYYDTNPDIYSWDINAIKERTGMEFYIIDAENKVAVTTYGPSLGLDFEECCEKFADLLDERRMSDEFFSDGLDNSAVTQELWKYSYLSTSDHKYILEFGVPVHNSPLFEAFNFFDSIEQLVNQYKDLLTIRVISHEGFFLQSNDDLVSVKDFSPELQSAYNRAEMANAPSEIVQLQKDGRKITNRFVPYEAEFARGNSTDRIIYFQYSNDAEIHMLKHYQKQTYISLAISMLVACVLLAIIIKILLSTIRLATYDTLTGIYNRASYLDHMDKTLKNNSNNPVGLLLIDLDNFKYVNDQFGHIEGDVVLKDLAKMLKDVAKNQFPVRFGGDEFAVVITKASEEKLERYANQILKAVHAKQAESNIWQHLTVSIGGALQHHEKESEVSLFMRADKALYVSKNNGKDRYSFEEVVE